MAASHGAEKVVMILRVGSEVEEGVYEAEVLAIIEAESLEKALKSGEEA